MWITILITAIVVVFLGGIAILVVQRRNLAKASVLEQRKKDLVNLKVHDQLVDARKMALTGKSLADYQDLEGRYGKIRNTSFLNIDQGLNLVMSDASGFNLWKTQKELKEVTQLVDDTDDEIQAIQDGLVQLQDATQRHEKALEELQGSYTIARQTLKNQKNTFGPAYPALMKFIDQLEADFKHFSDYTKSGDQVAAGEIYEQLGMESTQLETMQNDVPQLFQSLNHRYVDQLMELADAYDALVRDGIVFEGDAIPNELNQLDNDRLETLDLLADLKLKEVKDHNSDIEMRIQSLYDLMQKEMDARKAYVTNRPKVSDQLARLKEQNQVLALELDRLRSSFTFNHQEVEKRNELLNQIEQVEASIQAARQEIDLRRLTYSQALELQKQWVANFDQLEKDQVEIWQSVRQLEPARESARKMTEEEVDQVKSIRHRLERMNLPGLPAVYLEYFYNVTGEIERLNQSVSQKVTDMDEVQRQMNIVAADLDTLKEKTQQIMDEANLAEQLMQYANRYRANSSDVERAYREADRIYHQDFQYGRVMDILGKALDQVDVGIYEKIVNSYQRHRPEI
ncbi:septation ring formation regulator EzrA [Eupransor demetentiae]|uniref:Septation ring formation regulator EzrA n=1 Tax=Eupransor demetentiae TaxID=3109584 RepID=A0ABP0ER71_9LACO|nr:Septation ring formation regulator EzrA (EzrA) [Lactobacillaceae bacterium LMG 33000]